MSNYRNYDTYTTNDVDFRLHLCCLDLVNLYSGSDFVVPVFSYLVTGKESLTPVQDFLQLALVDVDHRQTNICYVFLGFRDELQADDFHWLCICCFSCG